jgi:hypothetical protein
MGELEVLEAVFDKSQLYSVRQTLDFFDSLRHRVSIPNKLILLKIFIKFRSQEALGVRSDCINELLNMVEHTRTKPPSVEDPEDSDEEFDTKKIVGEVIDLNNPLAIFHPD